jgi:hypothetical protein
MTTAELKRDAAELAELDAEWAGTLYVDQLERVRTELRARDARRVFYIGGDKWGGKHRAGIPD